MTRRIDQPGLLLVGHGTRSQAGVTQFRSLVERLARDLAPTPVEPAFLELQQPDIAAGVQRLIEQGVRHLTVMPLLLFAAEHAKMDIPKALKAAVARIDASGIRVSQAAHLGCHPALLELSSRRFHEALASQLSLPAGDCCLLMVGRGSHDETATAEMYEFARLRQLSESGMPTEVAFLAMARPLLRRQLTAVAAGGFRRVIVQPHLLFEGELAESIRQQVASIAHSHSQQDWIVTPLLADSPVEPAGHGIELLAEAIWARCGAAGIRVVASAGDH